MPASRSSSIERFYTQRIRTKEKFAPNYIIESWSSKARFGQVGYQVGQFKDQVGLGQSQKLDNS